MTGEQQALFVVERLLAEAAEDKQLSLPTNIYRCGYLSGDSRTGYCTPTSLVSRLLSSMVDLKVVPQDRFLDLNPVDFVAKWVVATATSGVQNSVVHVLCPNRRVGAQAIQEAFALQELEYTHSHIHDIVDQMALTPTPVTPFIEEIINYLKLPKSDYVVCSDTPNKSLEDLRLAPNVKLQLAYLLQATQPKVVEDQMLLKSPVSA